VVDSMTPLHISVVSVWIVAVATLTWPSIRGPITFPSLLLTSRRHDDHAPGTGAPIAPAPPAPARAAPGTSFTVTQAHTVMQQHMSCDVDRCARKAAAFATLVDAGLLIPDRSYFRSRS
jgi:hypothetical protein